MGIWGEDSQLASFRNHISFFQICRFLLACAAWCLCISAASTGHWRRWEMENTTKFPNGLVWIGIWDVCYDSNITDFDLEITCISFEVEHLFLPKEIFVAQDLMSLCAVVESLAIVIFFFAYWNIIKNEDKKRLSFTFFTIGGFLSLTSGIVILVPITWNMLSVLNNENIEFPESFEIPSHPKHQDVGVSIHFGYASAVLQIMSGLVFIGDRCLLIRKKTHPLAIEQGSHVLNGKDSTYCKHCGSSLTIVTSDNCKHICESSRDIPKPSNLEVAFQIPMGPIPDQRIAH